MYITFKCVFEAYEIVVKWRKNVFELPTGSAGKAFIVHMKSLIDNWCDNVSNCDYALKALMIMPHLLLQKPNAASKL